MCIAPEGTQRVPLRWRLNASFVLITRDFDAQTRHSCRSTRVRFAFFALGIRLDLDLGLDLGLGITYGFDDEGKVHDRQLTRLRYAHGLDGFLADALISREMEYARVVRCDCGSLSWPLGRFLGDH